MTVRGSGITRDTLKLALACHFCSTPCTDDDLCRGCKVCVCAACDNPVADERPQAADHGPEDHRRHVP